MAEKKREFLARKGKEAGDMAAKAAKGASTAWNQLSDKSRKTIQDLHLERRPLAIAKIKEIRTDAPKATPLEVQEILDSELSYVEASKGPLSMSYTSAASLYVLSSMELRGLDPQSKEASKALFTLLVVLDSRAVRNIRRVVNVAMWVVPFFRGAKVAGGVAKGAKVVQKATAAKKVLKAAKVAALPAAKVLLDQAKKSGKITTLLIDQTNSILGKAPKVWAEKPSKPSAAKSTKKK